MLKSKMQQQCRQVYNKYKNNIINPDNNNNSKRLWSFLKSKECYQMDTTPLKHEGIIYSDNKTEAELLNKQFSSVLTVEPEGDLPDLGPSLYSSVPHIQVQEKCVYKQLETK